MEVSSSHLPVCVNANSTSSNKILRLISIEYPGIVQNTEKALVNLGGISKISEDLILDQNIWILGQNRMMYRMDEGDNPRIIRLANQIYYDANRRIELRFRPSDAYCKPVCGERYNTTSLLIKIIRRKKKAKIKLNNEIEEHANTYEVIPSGVVHTTFKFDNMCDFQYLPVIENPDQNRLECIYNNLLPQGITSSNWLDGPSTLFLPPATFSRMDSPQDYRFRKDANECKTKVPKNVICRTRQKRTHFALFQSFENKGVPAGPLKGAIAQIRYKLMDSTLFTKLREEFSKRPIWSKNALRVRLKFSKDKLKCLLPTVAYYFPTGPWRNLWVLFGYDPRTQPNAWLYQTFDFRIRQAGGCKTKVEAKRSSANYILPYKSVQHTKRKVSVIKSFNMEEEPAEDDKDSSSQKMLDELSEEFYLFRVGTIPPYRQMFYQYVDIKVPEIQALLESAILNGANKVCCEKNGWLPAGVETKCRDILSNLVEKTIAQRNSEGKILKEEELMSNSDMEEDFAVPDFAQEGNSTEDEI